VPLHARERDHDRRLDAHRREEEEDGLVHSLDAEGLDEQCGEDLEHAVELALVAVSREGNVVAVKENAKRDERALTP
jgi:hypothetical protein